MIGIRCTRAGAMRNVIGEGLSLAEAMAIPEEPKPEPEPAEPEQPLSAKEAAKALGVSTSTVYTYLAQKKPGRRRLRGTSRGGTLLVTREAIAAFKAQWPA